LTGVLAAVQEVDHARGNLALVEQLEEQLGGEGVLLRTA
jgi:hypothetical protein